MGEQRDGRDKRKKRQMANKKLVVVEKKGGVKGASKEDCPKGIGWEGNGVECPGQNRAQKSSKD